MATTEKYVAKLSQVAIPRVKTLNFFFSPTRRLAFLYIRIPKGCH